MAKHSTNKSKKKEKKKSQQEINLEHLQAGFHLIQYHGLFGYCTYYRKILDGRNMGKHTYATITSDGILHVNETLELSPEQWAYVIAHHLLHLAFGHFDAEKMPGYYIDQAGKQVWKTDFIPQLWNMACDIYVDRFLQDIKFGQSIHDNTETIIPSGFENEVQIYNYLLEHGISGESNAFGTAAIGAMDLIGLEHPITYDKAKQQSNRFTNIFRYALARSVRNAVQKAAGESSLSYRASTPATQAAEWFVNHYPLLGGLASHFRIIEDIDYCHQHDIQIAAIDVTLGELYINPAAPLTPEEMKFVIAHEYLHAGLMHHERCNGRDHYLWNVACDFVINNWLHELQIGVMPKDGLLYDESLRGMSAESIYDLMLSDMKKYAKLDTFRGYHQGDILSSSPSRTKDGVTLDDFCRSALQQGLEYHISSGRGLLDSSKKSGHFPCRLFPGMWRLPNGLISILPHWKSIEAMPDQAGGRHPHPISQDQDMHLLTLPSTAEPSVLLLTPLAPWTPPPSEKPSALSQAMRSHMMSPLPVLYSVTQPLTMPDISLPKISQDG